MQHIVDDNQLLPANNISSITKLKNKTAKTIPPQQQTKTAIVESQLLSQHGELRNEFSHLLCQPYCLRCTLLLCIHCYNWYFGRDAILNLNQEANWQLGKQRKQALANKGYQKDNHSRQFHVYRTGDKVLQKIAWETKINQDAYIGPYSLTEVWNNGMYVPVEATSQTPISTTSSL